MFVQQPGVMWACQHVAPPAGHECTCRAQSLGDAGQSPAPGGRPRSRGNRHPPRERGHEVGDFIRELGCVFVCETETQRHRDSETGSHVGGKRKCDVGSGELGRGQQGGPGQEGQLSARGGRAGGSLPQEGSRGVARCGPMRLCRRRYSCPPAPSPAVCTHYDRSAKRRGLLIHLPLQRTPDDRLVSVSPQNGWTYSRVDMEQTGAWTCVLLGP